MTTDSGDLADKLWVELIKAGNGPAFNKIVDKYQKSVYNVCYKMLGDSLEAEDATQEVFLRVYAKLDSYNEAHKFSTWLFSIASHYCIDRLRPHRHQLLSWDDSPPEGRLSNQETFQPEKMLLQAETSEEIKNLLKMLPSDYRRAVVLKYWDYRSYQDIAQMLNTTVAAIKSRLFRARKMMARAAAQQRTGQKYRPLAVTVGH